MTRPRRRQTQHVPAEPHTRGQIASHRLEPAHVDVDNSLARAKYLEQTFPAKSLHAFQCAGTSTQIHPERQHLFHLIRAAPGFGQRKRPVEHKGLHLAVTGVSSPLIFICAFPTPPPK